MKISKTRLREIIREEINEVVGVRFGDPKRQKNALKDLRSAVEKVLDKEDVNYSFEPKYKNFYVFDIQNELKSLWPKLSGSAKSKIEKAFDEYESTVGRPTPPTGK